MDKISCLFIEVFSSMLIYSAAVAGGGVYKWVDKDGNVHYGDKPPETVQKQEMYIPPPSKDIQLRVREEKEKKKPKQKHNDSFGDRDALIRAVKENNLQMVVKLLARNTYYNSSVIHISILNGNISIFEALMQGNGHFSHDYLDKIMMTSIRNLRPKFLKILIKHGANAGIQDRFESPLILAINKQAYNCIQILLKNGAMVNERKGLPIGHAIEKHDMKLLNILIKNNADVNIADYHQANPMTPMMIAAYFNHVDMMRVLRDHGADTRKVIFGNSAMDYAHSNKHKEAIEFLLQEGVMR